MDKVNTTGENGYWGPERKAAMSFVVPVKDEEASLVTLFEGIAAEANAHASRWEVIFVDDGSTDGSWEVIRSLHGSHPDKVRAIRFRRNLGKASALAAGWNEAKPSTLWNAEAGSGGPICRPFCGLVPGSFKIENGP